MAGFYPVFLKSYWGYQLAESNTTFYLGLANSLASLFIVLFSPLLGSIADQSSSKKAFLVFFVFLGVVNTAALGLLLQGQWLFAIVLYVFAVIGFMGANVFYDSLLVSVSHLSQRDRVSALGYALGYLGGALVLILCILMTRYPEFFMLHTATRAVKASFFLVGFWWLLFFLPLWFWIDEPECGQVRVRVAIRQGLQQFVLLFRQVFSQKAIRLFLLAYWLYIDGVDTLIRMAVDYGMSIGFNSNDLIIALLLTQLVGFPAALFFGRLGEKLGTRQAIYIAILVYCLITLWGAAMQHSWEFYLLAVLIGLVQGGIQSLSRSFFSQMVPMNQAAQYFGFFNMMGKFAAVLGPLMMGVITLLSHDIRLAILSLLLLFISGGYLLSRVRL